MLVRKLAKQIADAAELVASAMLAALVAVAFFGVVDRYLLKTGQAWPEELSRFLLIWVSFLAAAAASFHLGHYTVSYFADQILGRGRPRRYLGALVFLASALCMVLLVPPAYALVERGRAQASPVLDIPLALVFAPLLIGISVMCLFFVVFAAEMFLGVRELPGASGGGAAWTADESRGR